MRAPTVDRRFALLALLAVLAVPAGPVKAQNADWLNVSCVGVAPAHSRACARGAVAASALQRHLGAAAGLGANVPGGSSTLGIRLGTLPRMAFFARAGAVRAGLPNRSSEAGLAGEDAFTIPTAHLGLAVGVFDGFFLLPTVGGFLSLDVFANTSLAFLPADVGFDETARAFSFGARVGILRESFTLPGITLSVARRVVDDVTLGNVAAGEAYGLTLKPSVTSLRAVVGKDLLAVGVMAGMGWDDFGGDVTLSVADGSTGTKDLQASRAVFFGGASMNFLVLQLSAEVGLTRGFEPGILYDSSYDPTASTFFGTVALRLTL